MNAKEFHILKCILTLLIINHFDGVSTCGDVEIDYLIDYAERNLSISRVNVMTESVIQLSPFAIKIARRINERIPSHIRYAKVLSSDEIQQLHGNLMETTFSIDNVKGVPERVSLTIGMLEPTNESQIMPKMEDMLQNFVAFNPLTRGKYLIHLIIEAEIDLQLFFYKAWSWKFLDLTVIQWIRREDFGIIGIGGEPCAIDYEGLSYTFNPFDSVLTKEAASKRTEYFPDKLKNLKGYPLVIHHVDREKSEIKGNDSWDSMTDGRGIDLMRALFETVNCSVRLTALGDIPGSPEALTSTPYGAPLHLIPGGNHYFSHISKEHPRRIRAWAGDHDFVLPTFARRNVRQTDYWWEWNFYFYLSTIRIPDPVEYHFHLLRPKTYERRISLMAIIAFGGLFFTAFIFAVWAQFLGFKERNWSFLNILTAQMGGSIAHRGRMKLSEKIFQMSIYIATFVVVTLGTDYMLQIFVEYQELPEIKTIQDLADSNMDFVVRDKQKRILMTLPVDSTLFRIYNRTSWSHRDEQTHSFCELPTTDSSTLDESINLCVTSPRNPQHVLESSHSYQINEIEDPVVNTFPTLDLGQSFSPFRSRSEELIYRFLQVGLVDKYRKAELSRWMLKEDFARATMTERAKDEGIPMQNQLWPILMIGWIAGIVGLIVELIWKRFIEKTEFGRAVRAFYSDSRSVSASKNTRELMSATLMTEPKLERGPIARLQWRCKTL